jgi:hypothetical protein
VLDCRSRGLSPPTVEFYLEALSSFRGTCAPGADASLAALIVPAARTLRVGLGDVGRPAATIAGHTRGLEVFSAWIAREGYFEATLSPDATCASPVRVVTVRAPSLRCRPRR